MRITPDDEVFRVRTVWLGPQGLTFPWTARYKAYAIFLITFLAVLLVEGLTPLHVGIPPIWEVVISVLATAGIMSFIDDEWTVWALAMTLRAEVTAPRPQRTRRTVTSPGTVTVEGAWDCEAQRYRARSGHGLEG